MAISCLHRSSFSLTLFQSHIFPKRNNCSNAGKEMEVLKKIHIWQRSDLSKWHSVLFAEMYLQKNKNIKKTSGTYDTKKSVYHFRFVRRASGQLCEKTTRKDNNLKIHLQLAEISYCQMVIQITHVFPPTQVNEDAKIYSQLMHSLKNIISLMCLTEEVLIFSCMAKCNKRHLTSRLVMRNFSSYKYIVLQKFCFAKTPLAISFLPGFNMRNLSQLKLKKKRKGK